MLTPSLLREVTRCKILLKTGMILKLLTRVGGISGGFDLESESAWDDFNEYDGETGGDTEGTYSVIGDEDDDDHGELVAVVTGDVVSSSSLVGNFDASFLLISSESEGLQLICLGLHGGWGGT